ncbi:MAG: DUF3078 domain-containing protein [Salinibacter sp.]
MPQFLFRAFACLLGAGLLLGAQASPAQPNGEDLNPPSSSDPVSDTATSSWDYLTRARFDLSQAAYKDWKEGGGNNSLVVEGNLRAAAERRGELWAQSHETRLAFGILNQEDQELRKAEDRIQVQSNLQYQGDGFFRVFNPTLAANLRTQFASGFDYDSNPFDGEVPSNDPRLNQDPPVETSAFFAPAFITESLGLTYEPADVLTLRLGAASKQTVIVEDDFRELYGIDPDALARVEAGTEFASSLNAQLSDNIRYRSDLNVFLAFNLADDPPDVLWENTLSLAVNDWLSTDVEFTALYDKNTTDAVQLKETISVGLSFDLL